MEKDRSKDRRIGHKTEHRYKVYSYFAIIDTWLCMEEYEQLDDAKKIYDHWSTTLTDRAFQLFDAKKEEVIFEEDRMMSYNIFEGVKQNDQVISKE